MFSYQPIIEKVEGANPDYTLDVLRLDLIDPEVSGNKWFKLKHNLNTAIRQNHTTLITFGGAHSNHIAATAAACKKAGIQAIGIIRGEDTNSESPTLIKAQELGMQINFVTRKEYLQKNTPEFIAGLNAQFGRHYLIPEGGNNKEGAMGCMEILQNNCFNYDYIFCACGTATTFAGLVASAKAHQVITGINVLKGENKLPEEATQLLNQLLPENTKTISGNLALDAPLIQSHSITNAYCFSGYAAYNNELVDFKNKFEKQNRFLLDHIYTTKLFYGIFDLMERKKFKQNARLLAIHSGGLQGNAAFEKRYHLMPMV